MRSFLMLSILGVFGLVSCSKQVDPGTPVNLLTVDKVYTDSLSTLGVVLSLYSNANAPNPNNVNTSMIANVCTYGATSADEGYYFNNSNYDPFRTNTLAGGSSITSVVYITEYKNINIANNAIAGIMGSNFSSPYKNQLIGECKFWRAYCYFILVNYFGGVPLVTGTDITANATLPRASVDSIYGQIVADLQSAKSLLPTAYPSAERARVNQYAVSALLARVYLYQKNWAAAESEATAVIGSGIYSLNPTLSNVFIKNSNEIIWQVVSNTSSAGITGITQMGYWWIPSGTVPNFVLYDTLAKAFEAGDQRKVYWTQPLTYNGTTYYYPYKYKIRTVNVSGNEYDVMLRLAEQYLIRSEARAMQNNLSGAASDLNTIRARAGLGVTAASTQADLLLAIEKERWVELFTEMSDRWFNLKRTGRIDAVLSLTKPQWQSFQALYPIPATEIIANPKLTQNQGY